MFLVVEEVGMGVTGVGGMKSHLGGNLNLWLSRGQGTGETISQGGVDNNPRKKSKGRDNNNLTSITRKYNFTSFLYYSLI
jgi:hypothetical protein